MSANAHPVRRTGGWLALGLLATGLSLPPAAAEGPPDPLEAFRQALRETQGARQESEAKALNERLAKLAEAIRRPGDLRRALLLEEWPGTDPQQRGFGPRPEVFAPTRAQLAARLERALAGTLKGGAPSAQLAALTMLADMEAEERQPRPVAFRPPHFAPRLAPAVRDLLGRTKEAEVRAAAALTLSRISPDPEGAVTALKQLLTDDQKPVVRRAGAKGLVQCLQEGRLARQSQAPVGRPALPGAGGARVAAGLAELPGAVLPVAGKSLAADGDAEVRRHCLEAIREATRDLLDAAPNFDQPREYIEVPLPPPGAVPGQPQTAQQRARENQYREFMAGLRKRLQPLAEAVNQQTPPVTVALKDPDAGVSLAAYRALEAIAEARYRLNRMAVAAPLQEGKAFEGLLDNAPKAVKSLADGLKPDNVRVQVAALYVLETLGPDAAPAAEALVRTLEDKNAFVRWGAARSLAAMAPKGGAAAVGGLAKGLADDNKDVRYTAALALQRHGRGARAAVKALAAAVGRKDDGRLRQLAAHALAAVGPAGKGDAVPALVSALSAPEAPARAAAAAALAAVGGAAEPKGVEALRKALRDPDAKVREAASDALLATAPPEKEAGAKSGASPLKLPRPRE